MTRCRTCDTPTPSLGKRTRCADCLRDHRDTAQVRSRRRRASCRDMPAAEPDSVAAQGAIAHVCHEDIRTATALLAFTEAPGSAYFTGGRHVEVGIALALLRPVYVIGPVENVFHCHALSRRFPDVDAAVATLQQEFAR